MSQSQNTPRQTREPSFPLIVCLSLLVLAAGLIGGGWYGHSRIVEELGSVPVSPAAPSADGIVGGVGVSTRSSL
jgi:hypothetical protein